MGIKKLLLAEDDVDDQNIFKEFLQDRKDILLMPVVENGVVLFDFLETITEAPDFPDLIILDQNMPKRNGVQTLQLLKQSPRYLGIPVMVYSTYTDKKLILTCTDLGASAVMSKPITKEGYHEMLDECLKML